MSEDSYVFVCANENSKEDGIELPVEDDGTLMLSVLQSQFDGASGLKYRNTVTGGWRAVKLVEGLLLPPDKGWSTNIVYVVVTASSKPLGGSQQIEEEDVGEAGESVTKVEEVACDEDYSSMGGYSTDSYKRKLEDSEGQRASKNPRSQSPDNYPKPPSPATNHTHRNQEDLIILGLEWTVTNEELRKYFEQFGEVAHCEVKKDMRNGKSRGFGFVRYGDRVVQTNVFESTHTIKGRRVELKYPKQSTSYLPNKLFVGCLPLKPEVSNDEVNEYFSQFGRLTDVYIPRPYRGFGFVTFIDPMVAQKVVSMPHTIRKSSLNVSFADPKVGPSKPASFHPDPFAVPLNYAPHLSRPHQAVSRYSYPGQPQPAYAMNFGPSQQMTAFTRPAVQDNQTPGSVAALRTLPGSSGGTVMPTASPGQSVGVVAGGVPGVNYGGGDNQQQQALGQSTWPIR